MWQVIMFNDLEELNDWLMEEADNIEEVKEYRHQYYIDYYPDSINICNEWSEYSVLVKMKEVNKDA